MRRAWYGFCERVYMWIAWRMPVRLARCVALRVRIRMNVIEADLIRQLKNLPQEENPQ